MLRDAGRALRGGHAAGLHELGLVLRAASSGGGAEQPGADLRVLGGAVLHAHHHRPRGAVVVA